MGVWTERSEEDILDCLEEAFRNEGSDLVENFHKHDRRHENGADLAVHISGETIHIQSKMKPAKKDIDQLVRLSKSVANKKIYVYVMQPSRPFLDQMIVLKEKLDFWDSKRLHEFLISNRSQLYLRFMFLDCRLIRNVCEILLKIFQCSKVNPKPLEFSILEDWWSFKDRAVKLHASVEHLEFFLKDKLLSQDSHDPLILNRMLEEILLSLDITAEMCSKDLLELVTRIGNIQPSVLSSYVSRVLRSSSWIGMGRLKDEIGNPAKARNIIQKWLLGSSGNSSEYSLICGYLRELHHAANAIEDGVDFVFKEFLDKNLSSNS